MTGWVDGGLGVMDRRDIYYGSLGRRTVLFVFSFLSIKMGEGREGRGEERICREGSRTICGFDPSRQLSLSPFSFRISSRLASEHPLLLFPFSVTFSFYFYRYLWFVFCTTLVWQCF
jgi:hypothetical protein